MATIILSHEVKDFAVWKTHFEADSARRSDNGLKELSVGTQSGNPNKVYIIWEGDESVIDKMLNDPELAEKMKEAGVISKPEVLVINS